jgi:hypothetical protein
MNKQFLRNWVLCIALTTTAIGSTGKVWADDTVPASPSSDDTIEVNLVDTVNAASDGDIQQAVQEVNKQIAALIPSNASDDQVIAIRENMNQLSMDSKKPGFKEHMASILRTTGHYGKKGGIILLKATGISASAILGVTIAPFVIGANLVTSAISGKGMFATHPNTDPNSLDPYDAPYGEFGGAVGEIYVLVGLYAAGFTAEPLVLFDTIFARVIQETICGTQNPGPEIQSYCRLSNGTYDAIVRASALVGDIAGKGIHLSIVIPAHLIKKLFHHKKRIPISDTPAVEPMQVENAAPTVNPESVCPKGTVAGDGLCLQN